jgi:DNA (cytosine-5)-methyltransferase 1
MAKTSTKMRQLKKPKFVVIENVLNLRTMKEPESGKPFIEVISSHFEALGYNIKHIGCFQNNIII